MFVVTEAGPEVVFWEVVIVFRQAHFWMVPFGRLLARDLTHFVSNCAARGGPGS